LIGMGVGIGLSLLFTQPASLPVFACFGVLASVHLFCSYKALSSVDLRTLNQQRVSLLLDNFFIDTKTIVSPEFISKEERIIRHPKCVQASPYIEMGSTIQHLLVAGVTVEQLDKLIQLYKLEKHMTFCTDGSNIFVVLKEGCEGQDILRAYFNAYYLQKLLQSSPEGINTVAHTQKSLEFTQQHFDMFVNLLELHNWTTTHVLFTIPNNRAKW